MSSLNIDAQSYSSPSQSNQAGGNIQDTRISPESVFKRSLLMSAIISVLAFGVADENLPFGVIGCLGLTIAWLFSVKPSRPAPRQMINAVLLIVIGSAGIVTLRSGLGVVAFAVFAGLLLFVKLFDLRTPRDCGQIIVLSVAMIVASVLTSNTLLTGVFLLVGCLSLMRSVLLFQIFVVTTMSRSERSTKMDISAMVDIRSVLLAGGFLCLLLGSAVFILLPRNLGSQAFGQWGASAGSVSGFSSTVELDRPGLISTSQAPVLDLTITDRDGVNIGSSNGEAIYLRGSVLTHYEDGQWGNGQQSLITMTNRPKVHNAFTTISPKNQEPQSWDRQYEMSIRSTDFGKVHLFSPWKMTEFRVGPQRIRVGVDFDRGLIIKDGIGGSISYSVRTINDGFYPTVFPTQTTRGEIGVGFIHPEVRDLAQQVLEDADLEIDPKLRPVAKDQDVVRVFERYLRSQYAYSLDSQPVPRGDDATRWFLFDRRAGHCEYFASALTLMCRASGIPARVITGYVASDFNEVTGQYTVRESNAHAWVEAQVAPNVWMTFDGTPPADFDSIHVPKPSIFRSMSKLYESIESLWVRSVVGFDSSSRSQVLGSQVGDFGATAFADKLMRRFAQERDKLVIRAFVTAIAVFVITFGFGLLLMRSNTIMSQVFELISMKLFKRHHNEVRLTGVDELEHELHELLDQQSIPKPEWKPLKEHLAEHSRVIEVLGGDSYSYIHSAANKIYSSRFMSIADHPSDKSGAQEVDQLIRFIRTLKSSMHIQTES